MGFRKPKVESFLLLSRVTNIFNLTAIGMLDLQDGLSEAKVIRGLLQAGTGQAYNFDNNTDCD